MRIGRGSSTGTSSRENILLEDGHAILADFGVARAVGSATDSRMTATGITLGTPAYMSPEQSSADQIDERSDLYSLACVLFEMLAGEPPFTGPTAQSVMAKRMTNVPPRVRTVRPSVPEGLERALLRALDRVPADRFASVDEFRHALETCSHEDPRHAVASRRKMVVAAAAVVILAVAAWVAMGRGGDPATTTVAVLPLVNSSADPEHAYLAEGLTDALIGDLVRVSGVRVISRASVMMYASGMGGDMAGAPNGGMDPDAPAMGGDAAPMLPGGMSVMDGDGGAAGMNGGMKGMGNAKSLADIARELGADVLLQGNLLRDGDSVRVVAALIRSPRLNAIWEGSYVRHVRELFALQRDLASAIVAAVIGKDEVRADAASVARSYHPDAHEAYLKGAYFQAHWKLPQAVAAFERAVEIDPTHAMAQAGLSRAWYFLAFFGDVPPSIAFAGMRRAATAALEQDSLVAEAHAQLALVKMLQEWDWDGAERHFRRALEISPGHAQIRHDYAHFLLGQGRHRESMEQTEQAVALDPVNPMLISCLGWHSLFDARFEDAARHASEANMMMPDHWAQVVLGWAMLGQGKPDAALVAFREATRLNESAFTLAALGYALAAAGRETEAREILRELLARADDAYVSPYDIATVYAGLGESDATFRWLRRAAEERSTFIGPP
jgi:eukaryotic-like serine/threonine-protein kinase